jgi:hypothetical protein
MWVTGIKGYTQAMKFGHNWVARFWNGNYHFEVQIHNAPIGRRGLSAVGGLAVKLPNGHVLRNVGAGPWYYGCRRIGNHRGHLGGAYVHIRGHTATINVGHGTVVSIAGGRYKSFTLQTKGCNLKHSWGWCSAYYNPIFRSCSSSGYGTNSAAVKRHEDLFYKCHTGITKVPHYTKPPKQPKRCTHARRVWARRYCHMLFARYSNKRCPQRTWKVRCVRDICHMGKKHARVAHSYVKQYILHYARRKRTCGRRVVRCSTKCGVYKRCRRLRHCRRVCRKRCAVVKRCKRRCRRVRRCRKASACKTRCRRRCRRR